MKKTETKRMTEIALLSAIIVVLTIVCTFIKFGPFSITLALAPIVIGASIYGPGVGAILGAVFGVTVAITGLLGWDGGAVMYLASLKPFITFFTIIAKGTLAGLCAGLIYSAIEKKNPKLAVTAAGIVCPFVNTLLFVLCMVFFFMPVLQEWAGGQNVVTYVIFGLTGLNFVIEVITNIVLSNAIAAIIKYRKGRR